MKMTLLTLPSEEEGQEQEEEARDRRCSRRSRKRIRYTEDVEDEQDEEDEDEDKDEEEEDERPGPSTHDQNTQEKDLILLPVTCGNKSGVLDVEKLHMGKACIECEGRWFSPPAFEDFGGKSSSKKWKTSIHHRKKPLQFWFERGSLSTPGFKRRRTASPKRRKTLSSDHETESSSEESVVGLQSAEETEEGDVRDEDWHPETQEEEKAGAESGGEAVEEEDSAVADDDGDENLFEGSKTELNILAYKNNAIQMKLQVLIKRLPEAQCVRGLNCKEHPAVGDWITPPDDNAQSEEEREHESPAKDDTSNTPAAHAHPTQTSDPPVAGGFREENGEEPSESFTQCKDYEEDGQREIKIEAVGSPLSATPSPDIKPDILSERCTGVSPPNVVPTTSLLDMCLNSGHTDVTTSAHNTAQLQGMEQEERCLQTVQGSDKIEEAPISGFDPDTIDLDQLKREKIKMQLKVLKLQEEYYTLQISCLNNESR